MMNGTTQELGISSTPSGANVIVNNVDRGTTPVTTKLGRKDNHTIKLELSGFHPYELVITRSVSGWVWGNIFFGGLIGLAIDAGTGGMYKLSEEQIAAQLRERPATEVEVQEDGVYVVVVLESSDEWEHIGSLRSAPAL